MAMVRMRKQLSKKQLDVIDDLFTEDMDEVDVLKKHDVKSKLYRKWLGDKLFADELKFRIESGKRQSELILAKFTPMAAAKLVALTEGSKEETVRKACLDIISLPMGVNFLKEKNTKKGQVDRKACLDPELASKLLDVLSKEKQ